MLKRNFQIKTFILFLIFSSILKSLGWENELIDIGVMGAGNCGTVFISNSSSLFFNPALLSFQEAGKSAGASFILKKQRKRYIKNERNLYAYSFSIKIKNFTIGGGYSTPFIGFETNFTKNNLNFYSEILVKSYSMGISFKFNDRIGSGISFNFLKGIYLIEFEEEGFIKDIKRGEGKTWNIVLGIFTKLNKKMYFGISYKNNFNIKAYGTDETYQYNPNYYSLIYTESILRFPFVISAGLLFKKSDNLNFLLDLKFSDWSRMDGFYIYDRFTEKDTFFFSDFKFKNTYSIKGGFEYRFKDKFYIRAGTGYEEGMDKDKNLDNENTQEFPQILITSGIGVKLRNFNINYGMMYKTGVKREYKTDIIVMGLSFRSKL